MRRRLDIEIVGRGLVDSRQAARREITAGRVVVDGQPASRPARQVAPEQEICLLGGGPRYVSRAGHKLEAALRAFAIDVAGVHCLDAGASTGGFTDCLLQAGAAGVVAVDVGSEQLHPRLQSDDRVTALEQTDIRSLGTATGEHALSGPAAIGLISADLSFISIRLVLPTLAALIGQAGPMLILVKPQFEAGRVEVARGKGVISDPVLWRQALADVVDTAEESALGLQGVMVSPLPGGSGNIEFIVWLEMGRPSLDAVDGALDAVVAGAEVKGK